LPDYRRLRGPDGQLRTEYGDFLMEQRTEEWFQARKGKITASSVGAILGLDPNRTREDVLREMVREHHGVQREFQGNIATQWGVTHEPEALMDFEAHTGRSVVKTGFIVHENMAWLGASPDGFVDEEDATLEIKCPFGIRDDLQPKFKTADDQPHYMAQMQVQMFVTNRSQCFFWQWTPHGFDLQIVQYDPLAISEIIPQLSAFRDEVIKACEDPDDHLQPQRVVIDTPRAAQMIAEYDDLIEAIEKAEERKKELLAKMVEMSKNRNAIFAGRKLTKIEKKGSISYSQAVKVLAPGANLEPWRGKPSSYWSVT
jgi:putative phage-type endonuclease